MRYHRYGRAIYAIGGNVHAARAAGIRVERVSWAVFVIASLLAALAGLLLSGRLGAVTAQQGSNLIFTTFAASVIGGISLNGGKGSLAGALAGVLLLGIVTNILTLSQIASFWIDATFGAIILIAQSLTRLTGGEAVGRGLRNPCHTHNDGRDSNDRPREAHSRLGSPCPQLARARY